MCGAVFALIAGTLFSAPSFANHPEPKSILVLNSYHKGYAWSDTVVRGIEETLAAAPEHIEARIEYMDTIRFPDQMHRNFLFVQYRHKYAKHHFDAIITSDNAALDFLLRRRADVFKDTPVVFAGIDKFEPEILQGHTAITGVAQHADYAETLKIARRLHPKAETIVVSLPDTRTGKAIKKRLEKTYKADGGKIQIEFWEGLSINEIRDKLAARTDAPIVLTIGTTRSKAGRLLSSTEKASQIAEASLGPVYGTRDVLLGHGIIGGKLVSGYAQGQTAAELAIEVLRGRRPEDIPVLSESPNRLMFDFNVLQRFATPVSDLPEGSTVINLPQTTYERYRDFAWTALLAIIALSAISAVLAFNIIQRKKAQGAYRESESRLRGFIENSPAAIFIKDMEGRYVVANEEFCRRLGVTPEMVIGKRSRHILSPINSELADRQDAEVIKTQSLQKRENEIRHADGIVHSHMTIKFPLLDSNGGMSGIGCFSTDITDINAANAEARELQAELAHVSRLSTMGEMATGFAHEINQPLTAISNYAMGCVHRLNHENVDTDQIKSAITGISEQALRAGEIIRRIRAFVGKNNSDQKRTWHPNIDVNETIRAAVGLLGNEALEHDVTINLMLEPTLPEISANAIQIQQTVVNIARNAMEAMSDAGSAERILSIRTMLGKEGSVNLSVLDTGPGISEDAMSEIFLPFFTTKDEGMGMGLSICRSIITAHGGKFTARNRDRGGTEFHVSLPALDAA